MSDFESVFSSKPKLDGVTNRVSSLLLNHANHLLKLAPCICFEWRALLHPPDSDSLFTVTPHSHSL